jgi:hydrogenase maturation protein HypF
MTALSSNSSQALEVRFRGQVQGVGFRPTVWRIARKPGLSGDALDDAEGVLLRIGGESRHVAAFLDELERHLPRLARVEAIETRNYAGTLPQEFLITDSAPGGANTEISPDAAICAACAAELQDCSNRHHRYPFTSCTHCGPRLSIVSAIPYDRATTTMAPFALCPDCQAEYDDPLNRRFHTEAIACPRCGPSVALIAFAADERPHGVEADTIALAAGWIRRGAIVAIKGVEGYHLACDAQSESAFNRLRRRKRREAEPFALMARDLDIIRRYCAISAEEEHWLSSAQAPIVVLRADGADRLPEAVAPAVRSGVGVRFRLGRVKYPRMCERK